MKPIILVALLAVAAAGAGAFGWMQMQENAQTKLTLASANAELQKAKADAKTARDDLGALRKQFSEQQVAFTILQAEMVNARGFLEAEKASTARLRDELARQKEEFANALKAARSAQAGRPYDSPRPVVVRPGSTLSNTGRTTQAPGR
jgi:uncharacterized protein HemX